MQAFLIGIGICFGLVLGQCECSTTRLCLKESTAPVPQKTFNQFKQILHLDRYFVGRFASS